MGFFSFLGIGVNSAAPSDCELPNIYPLSVACDDFVKADIIATYTKILTDTLERTHGIPDDKVPLLWDNCLHSEAPEGLVSLLVNGMADRRDVYIYYNQSNGVLRKATPAEQETIAKDYKARGESPLGIFLSFTNYRRTQMLLIYSAMEYCVLASLHKTVNISKAVQVKISELRKSVSLADEGVASAQAKSMAQALARGADILLDAGDEITTATPDTTATEKAIGFLDAKRAYYLDLPMSYISGIQTTGIGSTGEADMRAVERGLKQYYFSIIKPAVEKLFSIKTEFRSHDFRHLDSALETLKSFELASEGLISLDARRAIIARMFQLDPKAELKALEAEAAEAARNPAPVPADDADQDETEDNEA